MTITDPARSTAADPAPGSRWLEGNFGPVGVETTAYDLEVTGAIPPALAGRYVRSGPNPVGADPANHHWFLGDGMVHGVELRDGRANWYRNRWVVSPEQAARAGRPPVEMVPDQLFGGSGNTNVIHHAGRMFAINELSCPYELTPELETVRQWDFGGPLPAGTTAHPKFDPDTGDMHVMAYSFVEPYLRYHVISAAGAVTHTEEVAVGGPVMVHDMGLTQRWAIALDLPVVFSMDLAASGRRLPYAWDPDYTPRLGFVPRDGSGATRWVEVDPCYVFHPLNAYDDGSTVVIDLVRHPKMFASELTGPNEGVPTMERWVIDPEAGTWSATTLDDRPQEFPRADERLASRRHRFGYAVHTALTDMGGTTDAATGVLKYDVERGTVEEHSMGSGRVVGEVVFVPAADDAGEDDGWLVGYVYDRATDRSELVILDAHDIGADPVARVHLPTRVPAGFHGNWIPDRALGLG